MADPGSGPGGPSIGGPYGGTTGGDNVGGGADLFGYATDTSSFTSGENSGQTVADAQSTLAQAQADFAAANTSSLTAGDIIGAIIGILVGVVTGSVSTGKAASEMIKAGLNTQTAYNIAQQVKNGTLSPQDAGELINGRENIQTGSLLDPNRTTEIKDPANDDFWGQLVEEWQSTKEKVLADDLFRKEKTQEAIGSYNKVLTQLLNEAQTGTGTFKPITVGMGDFRTSFQPKSNFNLANELTSLAKAKFGNELIGAETLQPNTGEMAYLDKLTNLAQFQKELENRINLADINNREPDDQGSWLDAISDIINVTSEASDLIKDIF